MKKIINVLIAFALATAASSLVAQDAASSQSTAPSSQSVAANSTSMSNDGDLTQQLQSKFGQDPAFANAQVSVTNGTALITGTVAAKADKKRAKDLAKSIAGVKHVKEQLSVNPSAGKSTNSAASNNPANASVAPQTPKRTQRRPLQTLVRAPEKPAQPATIPTARHRALPALLLRQARLPPVLQPGRMLPALLRTQAMPQTKTIWQDRDQSADKRRALHPRPEEFLQLPAVGRILNHRLELTPLERMWAATLPAHRRIQAERLVSPSTIQPLCRAKFRTLSRTNPRCAMTA